MGRIETQILRPHLRVSGSVGLGWGPGIGISNQFPLMLMLLVQGRPAENHRVQAVLVGRLQKQRGDESPVGHPAGTWGRVPLNLLGKLLNPSVPSPSSSKWEK